MKPFSHILFFLALACCFAAGAQAQTVLDEASQAYRAEDYKKSIELYEQAVGQSLAENRESADVYYNLGNAYFRDGQLARAILNYERALLLNPADADIRHNLRFARARTEDRIETAGNLFLTNWITGVQNLFSSNGWAKIAIALFVLFLVCVGVFLFVRRLWARQTAFYAGLAFFVLVVAANLFAFGQKRQLVHRHTAIVMRGGISVQTSPDANSSELFRLHEGTKVRIRNTDGNWVEIEIANGSVGWTAAENVEVI